MTRGVLPFNLKRTHIACRTNETQIDQRTHTLPQSTQGTHSSQETQETFSDRDNKQVET